MPLINTADAVYVGGTLADRVYLGDTLVWEPGEPPTNMITNPSFESWTGTTPDGWTPSGVLTRSTTEFYTGTSSIQVRTGASAGVCEQAVPLLANQQYRLQARYKNTDEGATPKSLAIRILIVNQGFNQWYANASGVFTSTFFQHGMRSVGSWGLFSLVFTTVNAPVSVTFSLRTLDGGTYNGWFDDIELIPWGG